MAAFGVMKQTVTHENQYPDQPDWLHHILVLYQSSSICL